MGTINDKVMVVVGHNIEDVYDKAKELLKELEWDIGPLLSPLVRAVNGRQTFTVATTGSNVGWGRCEEHALILKNIGVWITQNRDLYRARWAIIDFPDAGPTKMVAWDTVISPAPIRPMNPAGRRGVDFPCEECGELKGSTLREGWYRCTNCGFPGK